MDVLIDDGLAMDRWIDDTLVMDGWMDGWLPTRRVGLDG